jgi:hypothetical protein
MDRDRQKAAYRMRYRYKLRPNKRTYRRHYQKPFDFILFHAQTIALAIYKRQALNGHLLERFICMLDLDPTLIKSHPNDESLLQYGSLTP